MSVRLRPFELQGDQLAALISQFKKNNQKSHPKTTPCQPEYYHCQKEKLMALEAIYTSRYSRNKGTSFAHLIHSNSSQ